MKFYRNAEIERIASEKLQAYALALGTPLVAPIPIELVAEKAMGLNLLWDSIKEQPGEVILGGLIPSEKTIILNENHQRLFESKPGIERFTIGHELGHWELFAANNSADTFLPGMTHTGPISYRETGRGTAEILKALIKTEEGIKAILAQRAREDLKDEARAVNRFSGAILMPAELLRTDATGIDRTQWQNLYRLAEKYVVTISAMTVRLQQLNLLGFDDHGKLYNSPDEAKGQMTLGME